MLASRVGLLISPAEWGQMDRDDLIRGDWRLDRHDNLSRDGLIIMTKLVLGWL